MGGAGFKRSRSIDGGVDENDLSIKLGRGNQLAMSIKCICDWHFPIIHYLAMTFAAMLMILLRA
jgi:hypothetical protein